MLDSRSPGAPDPFGPRDKPLFASGLLRGLGTSRLSKTVVVAQEFSGELFRAGEYKGVRQAQLPVPSPNHRRTFGHRRSERSDRDPHGCDRVARLAGTTGASERDKRLGVCARWSNQPTTALIGSFNIVDRAVVVCVCPVQQSDQDAGVKDQRSHSWRRRSSSPCS